MIDPALETLIERLLAAGRASEAAFETLAACRRTLKDAEKLAHDAEANAARAARALIDGVGL